MHIVPACSFVEEAGFFIEADVRHWGAHLLFMKISR